MSANHMSERGESSISDSQRLDQWTWNEIWDQTDWNDPTYHLFPRGEVAEIILDIATNRNGLIPTRAHPHTDSEPCTNGEGVVAWSIRHHQGIRRSPFDY